MNTWNQNSHPVDVCELEGRVHGGAVWARFKRHEPTEQGADEARTRRQARPRGHPVLAWMVDNIHVRTDPAGNIKPDKQKSTEKIDGVVATIMALDRAIRCGQGISIGSVYDERGLLVL